MSYLDNTLEMMKKTYAGQSEFIQAATEVLDTIRVVVDENPKYKKYNIIERLIEPDRQIIFRITWVDDNGNVHVNRGYRVQYNNSLGPYKGGMRFHPSVTLSVIKFLGFEQTFKNALTGFPIGGGKGGSDFDPKGKSEQEIMRFCQSLMNELYKHLGQDVDVPAGDIGVSSREVGFMYGQYKKLTELYEGVFTGKGLAYGGSLVRKEATGFGLIYFMQEMLRANGIDIDGKICAVSGSGNVAIYTAKKAQELGAKVVAMSDSSGWIYDEKGIDIEAVIEIKEVRRERISEYLKYRPSAKYTKGSGIWSVKCDIALPCATQNEILLQDAKMLVANGAIAVGEGANMPCDLDAIAYFQANNVLFAPAKAANAGGVATSVMEMSQNSMRLSWEFDEIDKKLQNIMANIFLDLDEAAKRVGKEKNYVLGANASGFYKVAEAMIARGIV